MELSSFFFLKPLADELMAGCLILDKDALYVFRVSVFPFLKSQHRRSCSVSAVFEKLLSTCDMLEVPQGLRKVVPRSKPSAQLDMRAA